MDYREYLLEKWMASLQSPRNVLRPTPKSTLLGIKEEGPPYEIIPLHGEVDVLMSFLNFVANGDIGPGMKFGALNSTVADIISSSAAKVAINGQGTMSLSDILLTAVINGNIDGLANMTLGNIVSNATMVAILRGTLSRTLGNLTSNSAGTVVTPASPWNTTPNSGVWTFSNNNYTASSTTNSNASYVRSQRSIGSNAKTVFGVRVESGTVTSSYIGYGQNGVTNVGGSGSICYRRVGGFVVINGTTSQGVVWPQNQTTIYFIVDEVLGLFWGTVDGVNFFGASSNNLTFSQVQAGTGGVGGPTGSTPFYALAGGGAENGFREFTMLAYPYTLPSGFTYL